LIVPFIPTAERNSPCAARFVAVFLSVEIERRLDFAVTQGISSATASSFNAKLKPLPDMAQIRTPSILSQMSNVLFAMAAGAAAGHFRPSSFWRILHEQWRALHIATPGVHLD